jgi:hypothetical protein
VEVAGTFTEYASFPPVPAYISAIMPCNTILELVPALPAVPLSGCDTPDGYPPVNPLITAG